MSAFASKLCSLWKLAVASIRTNLTLPEREARDFPFVASDIAQLHRLCSDPSAAIDNATWKDMLLERYCAELSNEVSIFGQHVLYQRLRAGAGGMSPERLQGLVAQPERVQELHRTCLPLPHADKEIANATIPGFVPSSRLCCYPQIE